VFIEKHEKFEYTEIRNPFNDQQEVPQIDYLGEDSRSAKLDQDRSFGRSAVGQ
jgi:hypothetical protein